MLKKNLHKVFGSQKSKLTVLAQVFQTAGVINPPPSGIGLTLRAIWIKGCFDLNLKDQ